MSEIEFESYYVKVQSNCPISTQALGTIINFRWAYAHKLVYLYTKVLVEIHSSHIKGLSTTKLHGIVVMILGWHVQGPGFKPRPDHLKLLLHNSWAEFDERNAEKRREKA